MKFFSSKFRIGDVSLRLRLLLFFICVSIIPILIVEFLIYTISFNIIKDKATQFCVQTVNQTVNEIDNLVNETYKIANMIASEPIIQESLRNPLHEDIAKRYSNDLKTDSRLYFIQSYMIGDFFGAYVVGANGGKYKSNYCTFKNDELRNTEWYRKVIKSEKPVWFGTHIGSFAVETMDEPFISVGIPVIDKLTGERSGIILIDFKENLLYEKIKKSRLGDTGYICIVDENNVIVTHPDRELISTTFQDSNLQRGSKRKSIYINKQLVSGWKVVGVIPYDELMEENRTVELIIISMMVVVGLFAIFAAWKISDSVANPIKKLISLMKKAEKGDLTVKMNVKYNDEIGQLGKGFNNMTSKISSLMDKIYHERKQLMKAELKVLQSQINPHFLYNTLDSIIWLSRAKKSDDVVTMVTALTKLFRIALSKGHDVILIRDEIEHIRSYLTIQNIRYKNKFTYNVEVDEKLYDYKTLKLILQPIVENAIYHGVKNKREVGHISVKGFEKGQYIIFEIIDTGVGIKPEKLAELQSMLNNKDNGKVESFGIKNVNERIKIFFGDEFGLKYFSTYGEGTKVEIKIPKLLEVEGNVKSIVS